MFNQKEKATRADYELWRAGQDGTVTRIATDPDRLAFHVEPELGWLNDPNGLIQVGDTYHIYHQYDPFDAAHGGATLWNHLVTKDFATYENCGPVLFPDSDIDSSGAYSGSAFMHDGSIHLFYTGNVKRFDRNDYDYVLAGREQNQIHMVIDNPYELGEKRIAVGPRDYPDDISTHVRDPKILEHDGIYYMVLGARTKDDRGCVLVYTSSDLEAWQYSTRIELGEKFGYMWECPDLFELDGELVLVCCPQGVPAEGWRYRNPHQCVWFRVKADWSASTFELVEEGKPSMVDAGFDFYAPQTFEDNGGRRLMIGWAGCPDATALNPTAGRGWQCALTVPRELTMREGKLCQWPACELESLRGEVVRVNAGEYIENPGRLFDVVVSCQGTRALELAIRKGVFLRYVDGMLTLDMGKEGYGRDERSVEVGELRDLRILSDTTLFEVFANTGEVVLTSRTYSPAVPTMELQSAAVASMEFYRLAR